MRVAIIGGGPAGYEAALVAVQLGAEVTLIEAEGPGGACVLTDCVPSKTLVATAEVITSTAGAGSLGLRPIGATESLTGPGSSGALGADAGLVNARVKALAAAQSADIRLRLTAEGIRVIDGHGRLADATHVIATTAEGEVRVAVDVVLLALGAQPRVLPTARPDGERILNWRQVYDLPGIPEELVVVGSGVTGAEFAGAYLALGSEVTLVSSRDRVLPNEDADAADVLEAVFARRGMTVLKQARAVAVERIGERVRVSLEDGRTVDGTHVLMAVGSVPATRGLGLEEAGVRLNAAGYVEVDKVSRTSVPTIYAAGDCTGVLLLASVAAMQGRIAMWHALGEAVEPIRLTCVSATVFTDPEIATVGCTAADVANGKVYAVGRKLPLATNARAKMQGISDGFVKVFCRPESGKVLGGVVVAPRASELILPLAMAVNLGLTVDQVAHSFSIYPSLSGSITEAARQLHQH